MLVVVPIESVFWPGTSQKAWKILESLTVFSFISYTKQCQDRVILRFFLKHFSFPGLNSSLLTVAFFIQGHLHGSLYIVRCWGQSSLFSNTVSQGGGELLPFHVFNWWGLGCKLQRSDDPVPKPFGWADESQDVHYAPYFRILHYPTVRCWAFLQFSIKISDCWNWIGLSSLSSKKFRWR